VTSKQRVIEAADILADLGASVIGRITVDGQPLLVIGSGSLATAQLGGLIVQVLPGSQTGVCGLLGLVCGPGSTLNTIGLGNVLNIGGGTPISLNSGTGNDTLRNGPGNDKIFGGPGDDTLKGGADNDLIDGGPNTDVCRGGLGSDTFVGCESTPTE
jgi:Ca2+-binding RTX toxin-like protein